MKVVCYCRVSTEEQSVKGVSLAAQEAKLRAYCEIYDHQMVEVIVDAGQSAKSLNRPGLQQALGMLKSGEAEGVLVTKLDRLTRSVRDLGELLEGYFQKCALISVAEQCDTSSASGRLVLNLLISVSQWEREVLGERTSAALQHLKAQGVKLGAPAFNDAAALTRMRELRAAGQNLRAIAATLTAEGFQTKKGGKWHHDTIAGIVSRAAE